MKYLYDLYPVVANRIESPVLVALGPVWPVTELAIAMKGHETTLFQMDVFQAARLREKLAQERIAAEVVVGADLWDLPQKFKTIIFPASASADRELKLDIVEQGQHTLLPGGRFITLSEYERDSVFADLHKKIFGQCSESPKNEFGTAFWSTKSEGEPKRRRHKMTFRARIADRPSLQFESWPGTFRRPV